MEGDEISLKQFANLVSTRLKEKNTDEVPNLWGVGSSARNKGPC
jgi:hypothetical protein